MPKPNRPTIEESAIAFLRMLSGANKSTSTITAYRTDLAQFASILLPCVSLLCISFLGCQRVTRGVSARRGGDVRATPGVVSVRHPARATRAMLPTVRGASRKVADTVRSKIATDSGAIELSTHPPRSPLLGARP
jgi:hypothetical protein